MGATNRGAAARLCPLAAVLLVLAVFGQAQAQGSAAVYRRGPFADVDADSGPSNSDNDYRAAVGHATHRLLRSIDRVSNRQQDNQRMRLSPADQQYAENMNLGARREQPVDVDTDTDTEQPQYPSPQQRRWQAEALQHDRDVEQREARRLRWHQARAPHDDSVHGPNAIRRRWSGGPTRGSDTRSQRRRWQAHRRLAHLRERASKRQRTWRDDDVARSPSKSSRVRQRRRNRRGRDHDRDSSTHRRRHHHQTAVERALARADMTKTQSAGVDAVDEALQAHSESNARNEELETRVAERLRRKSQRLRDVAESMRDKRSELVEKADSLDQEAGEKKSEAKQTQSEAVDLLAKLLTPKHSKRKHYLAHLADDEPEETAEKALKRDRDLARKAEVKFANAAVQSSHIMTKHHGLSKALTAKMAELKKRVAKARDKVADDQAALNNLVSPYTKTSQSLSNRMSPNRSDSLQNRAAQRTARAKKMLNRARQLRTHAETLRAKAKGDLKTHATLMKAAKCLEEQADSFETDSTMKGHLRPQTLYNDSLDHCGLSFRVQHDD